MSFDLSRKLASKQTNVKTLKPKHKGFNYVLRSKYMWFGGETNRGVLGFGDVSCKQETDLKQLKHGTLYLTEID